MSTTSIVHDGETVFITSGNENPITELGNNTGKFVKELDSTRPFMFPTQGPYFAANYQKFPDFLDIYSPHYPTIKNVREYAEKLERPIIFTEYAHQRGLARAGVGVQDLWEEFYKNPRVAGGAIWLFQDQGILRTTDDMKSVKDNDLMVWLDEHHYYDTHGFYAMDGIVYSDRTPQTDYWQVRKVYSSVQIKEQEIAINPGEQKLSLHVENRYDFRSLAGMKLKWSLLRNGSSLQNGVVALEAKPKETEIVPIDVTLPANLLTDIYSLELKCEDEKGRQFYERSIRLDSGAADNARWLELQGALSTTEPKLEVSDSLISVHHPNYQLKLDRRTGRLSLLNPSGAMIISAFGLHMGRNPTINDMGKDRERDAAIWRGNLLKDVTDLKTDARLIPEGIQIMVSGNYPRPGKPEESISGEYKLLVTRSGAIEVSYNYKPIKATGEVLEAGFAFEAAATQSEFRWLGQGLYAAYPGKDRLDEYGIFHLNRDDLYFPGNRRGVEMASLADHSGSGVLLVGNGMTLDLEKVNDMTILSHLALVPGERSSNEGKGENVDISSRIKAESIKNIAGKFTLLPLSPDWRGPLTKWFGSPSARVEVKKAYFHSYDQ